MSTLMCATEEKVPVDGVDVMCGWAKLELLVSFEAIVLLFGATAAVHGSNRVATSINRILHFNVGVPFCNYFGDLIVIANQKVAPMVEEFTLKLFRTIGLKVKEGNGERKSTGAR